MTLSATTVYLLNARASKKGRRTDAVPTACKFARFDLASLVRKCSTSNRDKTAVHLSGVVLNSRRLLASMEDRAARAARLRSMREAAGLDTRQPDADQEAPDTNVDNPVLKFRNYSVKDDRITHEKQAAANPPKYEQPVVEQDGDVEGEVTIKQVDLVQGHVQIMFVAMSQELLLSVAPKKPNWDLRRDVEPKLAKLERRTQRAMITIMQNQQQSASQEVT